MCIACFLLECKLPKSRDSDSLLEPLVPNLGPGSHGRLGIFVEKDPQIYVLEYQHDTIKSF